MDEGAGYTFLNGDVMDSIDTAVSNLSNDIGNFFTNNMGSLITIVGAFVAVGLIWWVVRFFRRGRGQG